MLLVLSAQQTITFFGIKSLSSHSSLTNVDRVIGGPDGTPGAYRCCFRVGGGDGDRSSRGLDGLGCSHREVGTREGHRECAGRARATRNMHMTCTYPVWLTYSRKIVVDVQRRGGRGQWSA